MMNFTDFTGLAGIAFAIVALAMQLPVVARLQAKLKLRLAVALFILPSIPFDGLSAIEFVRGATADLSITTLLLLSLALLPSPTGESERSSLLSNKYSLLALITLASVALYPFALGLSSFDPYRLGFGNLWLIAVLLLVALAAWLRRYTLIALCISLAVLAWSIGWYESTNLWNYLLDPWVAVYALVALVRKRIGFLSRAKLF